ncbi:MAG TPA: hypothetical protein VF070_20490 [Streptosporangiaceae bacterium]
MRLWILDRVRRLTRVLGPGHRPRGSASQPGQGPGGHGSAVPDGSLGSVATAGRHRRDSAPVSGDPLPVTGQTEAARPVGWAPSGSPAVSRPTRSSRPGAPAVRAGSARARVREDPGIPVPREAELAADHAEVISASVRGRSAERPVTADRQRTADRPARRSAPADVRARLPFTAPRSPGRPPVADGRRHCGSIERILWRQWDAANPPPPEVVAAVDRLAELPERIKERLTDSLDAIYLGPGGVPELDDMTGLRGVQLPSGRASWDACAGAYGERKIVVGSQPSPTPDVMCHEIGHALDDLDSPPGKWQSDSAQFRALYEQCLPHLASDFHRQPGGLGRKEFFADAFAAIASRQRPALVDMLSGETRTALRVMLYFNRRYDI